ncbi:transcriptional regulator [Anaerocolumna cellulosilytica]|uniref:Transcriptional regulator n=1 Tax=Anaerocolumna cellulosilytica TaxID=433286 RepID=A0A6S6RDA4_9FIRM|nr:PRD domain-containing protein [Anaerocolumna cellulosilytica]MBB5195228.1 beta-glucoside operon transcriptional antiterminator [Anaerocolumna cellulosilytica]BCJ96701.1 transcriptional regulator [Anaerocolumna cellulosilytica]
MRVVKVLNNSLILALDDTGHEIILMGKGIGFNKAIGYQLRKEEIEKVFVMKDKDISKNIIRLAAEIDSTFFELAKTIIDYGVENYQMELMEHIYLSLTDHLSFVVKRMEKGIVIENFYISEMKKFSPNEYQVGVFALQLIKDKLNLDLPVDEAGNIAFHFINAQHNNPYNANNRIITETVKDILDIVKYNFVLCYDEDSISYSRFTTHLRLFVQRLLTDCQLPEEQNDFLYEQIVTNCRKEYACVKKIGKYITEKFHTDLTAPEELYLTIHIHRVLEENKQKKDSIEETDGSSS